MDNNLTNGVTEILKTQLAEADQKIRFLEQQVSMTNQQFTHWITHLTFEHGEETEPGVWKLPITEENAPHFEGSIAFQVEPNEDEKKLTFVIISEGSERFEELKKAQEEAVRKNQQKIEVAKKPKNLIVEK